MSGTTLDPSVKLSRTGTRPISSDRIASVDLFRGFTMFLLIGESTRLYEHFSEAKDSAFFQFLGTQFSHHAWHGLHFWDLIQPFFMFIVGVSIPFAVAARKRKGDSDQQILRHAIKRSLLLLFFGWALYCIGPGRIVWRFQNVLAQLSVTYLVAFLIRNRSAAFQIIFTVIVLLITDLAYRFFPVEGFNQPWVAFHNLGAWANNKIEGVEKADIWASINAFPTIAHTVWGVLCGRLLMSDKTPKQKISTMLVAAFACLVVGYALDLLGINPIIKKIATSSFVFASGGWAILALCFFYWLLDVKKLFKNQAQFFIIVGMNSIFIYLFFEVGTAELLTSMFQPFTNAAFFWTGPLGSLMFTSIAVWAAMWYLCYWLYKRKIFFKI
jgi:predicted acyltransferase